jgi:[protein-PII] uridylyltransferase
MPKAYTASFDWAAIAEHASIAHRRPAGHATVGTCRASRLPGIALCIVADDRPGLLATISAALVQERLDIVAAEAYTHLRATGEREAIDIFWVQRLDVPDSRQPLSTDDLEHLEATLDRLVLEQGAPSNIRIPTQRPPAPHGATETVVRFIENRSGTLTTLEVETDDRTGMLLVLARALYEQRVQIVSSQVRTQAGRVRDRFEVTEVNDTAITAERRLLLQVAILSAVQEAFGQ